MKKLIRNHVLPILIALTTSINGVPIYANNIENLETGLCEHHKVHTAECGYTEVLPCTFVCKVCNVPNEENTELNSNNQIKVSDVVYKENDVEDFPTLYTINDRFTVDNITYKEIAPDKVQLIDGRNATGEFKIPATVICPYNQKEYKVVSIGKKSFFRNNKITGIIFPETITDIEDDAFDWCKGFVGTLTLPSNLQSIGKNAFNSCSGFTGNLVLPSTLQSIGDSAFLGCSGFTGSLTLPSNLQSIGDSAFSSCSGFTGNLTLPNTLQSIGFRGFAWCSGFTGDLILPDTLQSIGDSAFAWCSGFTGDLILPDTLQSIGDYAFYLCSGFTGSLTLPDTLQSIGDFAFYSCSGFTGSLTLPDTLQSIGDYTFYLCSGFTGSLTLPDTLQSIGDLAFSLCRGFTGSITLQSALQSIGRNAFYGCSFICNTTSETIAKLVYNSGYRNIILNGENFIFSEDNEFTEGNFTYRVTDPSNYFVKLISTSVTSGKLTIPEKVKHEDIIYTVTEIGDYAFQSCSGFTGNLILPDTLQRIGEFAFYDCSGFTGELTLPSNLKSIGNSAFGNCNGFTGELILPSSLQSIGGAAFMDCRGFKGSLSLPSNLQSIGDSAFYNCGNFYGNLTLPSNLQSIGNSAFRHCYGFMGNLTLPDTLQSIGDSAFAECDGLSSIHVGSGLQKIGFNALPFTIITTNSPRVQLLLVKSLDKTILPTLYWKGTEDMPPGAIATVNSDITISNEISIDKGAEVTIYPDTTLIVNGTLTVEGALTVNGTLDGSGQVIVNGSIEGTGIATDQIDIILPPLTLLDNMIEEMESVTFNGDEWKLEPEVFITILRRKIAFAKGEDFTYSYDNNITVGNASVTVTPVDGGKLLGSPVTKHFSIQPANSSLVLKVDREDNTYSYGDEIEFTASLAINSSDSKSRTNVEIELYYGDTYLQKIECQAKENFTKISGSVIYSTTDKKIPAGEHTITAVYNSDGNLNNTIGMIDLTINPLYLKNGGDIDTSNVSATKVYDGTTNFTNVPLNLDSNDIVLGDTITAIANGNAVDKNIGTKEFIATDLILSGKDSKYYTLDISQIRGNVTILPKEVNEIGKDFNYNVIKNEGKFSEPSFDGVNGEQVTGTFAYLYNGKTSYKDVIAELAKLDKGAFADVGYTFSANGNYTGTITGTLKITVVDIQFTGIESALQVKATPVYGGSWGEILTYNASMLTATLNGKEIEGNFTLMIDNTNYNPLGQPDAGTYAYKILFSATNDTKFQNIEVYSGTITVVAAELDDSSKILLIMEDKNHNGVLDSGDTLTVDTSAIVPTGGTMSYQWQKTVDGVTSIVGTDSISYTLTVSDNKGKLFCTVNFSGNVTGTKTSDSIDIGKVSPSGSSSSSGSSGNSSGAPIKPDPTENPALPIKITTTITPTITDKTESIIISEDTVNQVTDRVQEKSNKNRIIVEFKVDTKTEANNLFVNLPKSLVDMLVRMRVEELRINSDTLSIHLDLATLTEIQKQINADANLFAEKVANDSLSEKAGKIVGERPIYSFSITGVNGKELTAFGSGKVSISIPYLLGTGERAGNILAYYIDNSGNIQEIVNSSYDVQSKRLIFITNHFSQFAVGYSADTPDIANHWAKEDIEFAVARSLFADTENTKLNPETGITQDILITALGKLTDVSLETEKNIIGKNITFSPNAPVTREGVAVIIENYTKAVGYSIPKARMEVIFKDSNSIATWAKGSVKSMQMAGVMNGKDGNYFDPKGICTYAEFSAILHRYIELIINPTTAQGWTKNASGHWYYYKDGKKLTDWQNIDGLKYYFSIDGIMYEGWKQDTTTDHWYYWTNDGAVTGWEEIKGKKYYFSDNGIMYTDGWKEIERNWYYFYSDGTMAINVNIDGYEIGSDGVRKE